MSFSENLAVRMRDRRETKYRLAKSINVSQSTVANWLNGHSKPQLQHIGHLADHYGCPVEEIEREIWPNGRKEDSA